MILQYRSYAKYIAVLITIVLVAILFTQINLGDVITTLKNINPIYLIAGFILYTCSYFFRAWRFHILLNKEVSIKDLFHIECVHNMMNNLLPARTGELSYVYLLKKVNNRSTGEGVATLVVARIFDFIALAILFFIAVLSINDVPRIIEDVLWLVAVFIIGLLGILFMLFWKGRTFVVSLQKVMEKFYIEKNHFIIFILKKGHETVDSLEKIQLKKMFLPLFIYSFLIWMMNYLTAYLLIIGMGFQLSIFSVILGATFILLTTVLPIQGIGGFGTIETVWTLVFVPLGMPLNDAIISGFSYHIIIIFYYLILGSYGWLKLRS